MRGVPNLIAPTIDEVTMSDRQRKDRRVERTERLLRDALMSLIHEKPYANIVVKEILARANVGRSTFYAHFRDKEDLLASCMHGLLGSAYETRRAIPMHRRTHMLGFSLPLLEFHDQHRTTASTAIDSETQTVLHRRLQRLLAKRIAVDLDRSCGGGESLRLVGTELLARYVAATFGLVLNWWLESGDPLTPRDVDEYFHALVVPTLDAAGACVE